MISFNSISILSLGLEFNLKSYMNLLLIWGSIYPQNIILPFFFFNFSLLSLDLDHPKWIMKFKFLHEVINIGDWVQSQGPNHAFFLAYVLIYVSLTCRLSQIYLSLFSGWTKPTKINTTRCSNIVTQAPSFFLIPFLIFISTFLN